MTARKIITALTVFATLALMAGIAATAFSFGLFAPVSGKQAAAAAVAQTGGYAEEVEFEYSYHIGSHYEVDVIADGLKHKVIVDAGNGKVLAVKTKYKKHHDGHYEHPVAPAARISG